MADKVKGLTITLTHDIRIDDIQKLMDAIQLLSGVQHVDPVLTTTDDHINRILITSEIKDKLFTVIKDL